MAKLNARPSDMAMVSTAARPRQPHHAMGWLTWHAKDFFQILKPAKIKLI